MARALINVPPKVKVGDIIEIKTLVSHPMETGYRVGLGGEMIPRDIIQSFVCTYNGEEIYRAEFSQAIAANPYLTFHTMAVETGVLEFRWTGDNDFLLVETASITVE
jgi:sulfur-oxidizing protein SoxZ